MAPLSTIPLAAVVACAHALSPEEALIDSATLSAQRARPATSPGQLAKFVPIALTAVQESGVKRILIEASQRGRSSSRGEGMDPGVYGCVTSSYLLTFASGGREVVGAFHECGPGWVGFSGALPNINLEGEEQYRLAAILDIAPVIATPGSER